MFHLDGPCISVLLFKILIGSGEIGGGGVEGGNWKSWIML